MSLKKIANELGLSSTTVSRALNGYDDVAAETRERIIDAAKRLGYQPNSLARRLKMGRTDAIALAYPSRPRVLNNSTFLEMISWIGIELGKRVSICCSFLMNLVRNTSHLSTWWKRVEWMH